MVIFRGFPIGRAASVAIGSWTVAAMLAIWPVAAAAQSQGDNAQTDNGRVEYIFKRGDTLIDLAEKYLRKRSDYHIVQRLNRIADPHHISIGKKVRIPVRLLKFRSSSASLSAFRGKVTIVRRGKAQAPVKGMRIAEGSRLVTAAGSFLTLRLEDGSRVSMPSNSNVRIAKLRHILLTDSVDYEFAVDKGRIRSKIIPFRKKVDRYRVRTPVAVSAVRGTDYRVRVDEATGTAFSETVEGAVDVSIGKGEQDVLVTAGMGAAATVSGELVTATLLAPPEFIDPGKVQSETELQFQVKPAEKAASQRLLVSSDAGFVDILAEQKTDSANIKLAGLPDGRYFAKATSFSNDGFEGMPATYSFRRQLSTLKGSAAKGDFGFRFKWLSDGNGKRLYRFQLLRGTKTVMPMVDEAGLSQDVVTLSELPDGEYFWRVGVTQFSDDPNDTEAFQKWTDFEKLTVSG